MNFDPYLTSDTKINSKWIKDLNVSAKILKFLKENIRVNLHDHALTNSFLYTTPKRN